MGTTSTSVENPVNQIAELLSDVPAIVAEVPQVEAVAELLTPEEPDETTDADENQEDTVESLEQSEDGENHDEVSDEQIETLNNLADDLEIDIEDMYALNLNLSNDEHMTLGGLKDFYEANSDITVLREELKQQKEALQVDAETVKEIPQISNELLQARAQVMSIQDQYNRTDWDALRAENPGNYAALMQDFQQQFNIAKDNERIATETVDKHQVQARKLQRDRLLEAMPELKDDKVRQEAQTAVATLAQRYGFTDTDVGNIEDSRLMRLLIDAARLTTAQSTAKNKQVKTIPQAGKTSASRPVVSSRKASLKRLTEKARQTGDSRDRVHAIAALLDS